MLRDLWVVPSRTQGLQLCDQLFNVLLMKNGDSFMANETKIWEIFGLQIREKALNE